MTAWKGTRYTVLRYKLSYCLYDDIQEDIISNSAAIRGLLQTLITGEGWSGGFKPWPSHLLFIVRPASFVSRDIIDMQAMGTILSLPVTIWVTIAVKAFTKVGTSAQRLSTRGTRPSARTPYTSPSARVLFVTPAPFRPETDLDHIAGALDSRELRRGGNPEPTGPGVDRPSTGVSHNTGIGNFALAWLGMG